MANVTTENVAEILKNDIKVKVAAVDADGILRGKIMAKEKFLSSVQSGFGFSSAVFGWDMHDGLYSTEANTTSVGAGYADFVAIPQLSTFRRIPWEGDMPFFLLDFQSDAKPVTACPRGLMKALTKRLQAQKYKGFAGGEFGWKICSNKPQY